MREHPGRLTWMAVIVLLASLLVLGYAIVSSLDAAREGRIDTCIAVNELSRKIYITLSDFEVPYPDRAKFLPTTKCSTIP